MELTTGMVLLMSAFYGSTSPTINMAAANASEAITSVKEQKLESNNKNSIDYQSILLEDYIKQYFKDDPALIEVAKCESTFRHLGKDGNVIRGIANSKDVGVMQINEIYHEKRAEKLGIDIHTLEGNMAYAKWLYKREGLQPWNSSSKCWSKAVSKIDTDSKILAQAN